MKTITKDNVSDHVDDLIELAEKINTGEVTILTGGNGLGKSFIRKMCPYKLAEKKNGDKNKTFVSSTSMEARTGSNAEWGALSGALRDLGWTPTSKETLDNVEEVLKDRFKDRFIVIDEPEIGMGEETVLSLCKRINERIEELRAGEFMGVMIITHSRIMVQNLKADVFLNIEGMTKEEWLNREIVPTDLAELKERSNIIFHEIQDRINKSKK